MILVLVKGNLERVKDESYGRLFQSVKRHQLVLELFSKDFFGGKKRCTHSDLECTCADDSCPFKASVLSCWFYHHQSLAKPSHVADIATLFEPTSLFCR